MKSYFLLLTTLFCTYAKAETRIAYAVEDIDYFLKTSSVKHQQVEFLNQYFTQTEPEEWIVTFIKNEKEPILKEKLLHSLAQELAYHIPQRAHKNVLLILQQYSPQVLIQHAEGPALIPAFNIKAKAHGTESKWRSYDIAQPLINALTTDPIQGLKLVRKTATKGITPVGESNPQSIIINRAIAAAVQALDEEQVNQINTYLVQNPEYITGLDTFVVELSLSSRLPALAKTTLPLLTTTSAHTLLRRSQQVFTPLEHQQVLFVALKHDHSAAIAISFLQNYLPNNRKVITQLFELLDHAKLGNSAALALSKHQQLLPLLEQAYRNKKSEVMKNNAFLALTLHSSEQAINHLYALNQDKLLTPAQSQWLETKYAGDLQ